MGTDDEAAYAALSVKAMIEEIHVVYLEVGRIRALTAEMEQMQVRRKGRKTIEKTAQPPN